MVSILECLSKFVLYIDKHLCTGFISARTIFFTKMIVMEQFSTAHYTHSLFLEMNIISKTKMFITSTYTFVYNDSL